MLEIQNFKNIIIGHGLCNLLGTKIKVNLYLVDGLLIDTGPFRLRQDCIDFFNNHMIEQVALTHVHEDHSGMAYWLHKSKGVPIYLHSKAIENAQKKGRYRLYRYLMWGKRKPFNPQPMPRIIKTEKHTFEALETPGHTELHHAFYEKDQGWLFTGDLYLSEKVIIAFNEENMKQTITTLENLLELDFDTAFCTHTGVVHKGKEQLKKKLAFLIELQGKVNEYRTRGFTDREIDKIIYPKKLPISIVSQGEWSTYNIIHTI